MAPVQAKYMFILVQTEIDHEMLQECLFFCFLFWDLQRFVNAGISGRAFLLTR